MYIAPSQIVAIIDLPDVGACPTTLITMSQPVYVCESPAEVKRKLEVVTTPHLVNGEKSAAASCKQLEHAYECDSASSLGSVIDGRGVAGAKH
jgi:hypothetical protein